VAAENTGSGRRELYFEFVTIGSAVKATVLDAATAIEASILAPATTPRSMLERLAIRKLDYVLNRKRGKA
jgi:hypothetical protein